MANGKAFNDAVRLAKCTPGLGLGCHVNLVEGEPVASPSQIPNMVGPSGRLIGLRTLLQRLVAGRIKTLEIERECGAQVEKLLEAGIRPSHLDTHKHTHIAPKVAEAIAAVARRYGIDWVRRPFENVHTRRTNDPRSRRFLGRSLNLLAPRFERMIEEQGLLSAKYFTGFSLTGMWTKAAMEETLRSVEQGITELMCHPGYADSDLWALPTRLQTERQGEFEVFSDPYWRSRSQALGISLASYHGLSSSQEPEGVQDRTIVAESFAKGK